jgi:bacterioferritin (cytochrome b1)
MHTLLTQIQMNNLNTQIKNQSSSNLHPAQFTYQPVAMGDSRGNLPNADAFNKKKNILDILLKKLNTTKTASDKSALQTIK